MNNPIWVGQEKLDRLLSADEVAEHLGVKKQTLYRWRMEGKGPRAIRIGKFLRWKMSEITAFEESMLDPVAS